MASTSESVEYKTLVRCTSKLATAFKSSPISIANELFSKEFIPPEVHDKVTGTSSGLSDDMKATSLVKCVTKQVSMCPGKYCDFMALLKEPWLSSLHDAVTNEYELLKKDECNQVFLGAADENEKPSSDKSESINKSKDNTEVGNISSGIQSANQSLDVCANQSEHTISAEKYDSRPEPAELRKYVRNYVQDKWEALADELGLDDDEKVSEELEKIKEKWKSDNQKAAFEVLKLWLKHYKTTATWHKLREALNDVGLEEAVRSVDSYLLSCQNSPGTSGTTQAATATTQVLTEQNLETMDTSTSHCFTKPQYKLSMTPREYQKELAEPGIRGQNYIICAPTNSGKTLVAAMIIANHLEEKSQMQQKKPKVVFAVETLELADQQTRSLSKSIHSAHVERRTGNRGEDRKLQLHIKDVLHDNVTDIIVCTSGKLLDELKKKEISLLQISLMIIDECHSTECSKHFSNAAPAQIMRKYLELKEAAEEGPLPQVVGLTATPGMGKNPGLESATVVNYLIMLCAHMDATGGIQTVREHKEELSRYVRNPKSRLDTVDQNERKELQRIEREMQECETFLTFSSPSPRWSQQYEHAVKQRKSTLEGSKNPEDRDNVSTARLLEHYSQTLIKYTELPCAQATKHLEQQSDLVLSDRLSDHEKYLLERFTQLREDIRSLDMSENPILKKLELRLTDSFQQKPGSSGIVFVRTREQAEAISNWISDSEFASHVGIKARMLVGQKVLTDDKQREVTDAFRKKECNLIVATSVAEEGLDIKECNLIIRLHISGARSQAQMKGRARAAHSDIITIVANDPKKAYKDMANDMLIELTNHLIEVNCLPPPQQLQEEINHQQKAIMAKARERRKHEDLRRESHPAKDVELMCSKCKVIACRGSDIYCIDKTKHHVVPGEEFAALYEKVKHHSRGILPGSVIMKDYKIHCSKCNESWGILGTWPSGIPFPIIKCEKFSFHANGNEIKCEKWSECPFKVFGLSEWFAQNSLSDSGDS